MFEFRAIREGHVEAIQEHPQNVLRARECRVAVFEKRVYGHETSLNVRGRRFCEGDLAPNPCGRSALIDLYSRAHALGSPDTPYVVQGRSQDVPEVPDPVEQLGRAVQEESSR